MKSVFWQELSRYQVYVASAASKEKVMLYAVNAKTSNAHNLSYKKRKSVYDDQKCQYTVCSDKNCQETQSINMQPVKPSMDM